MKALNCVNFCYAEVLSACYRLLEVEVENCFPEDFPEAEPWGGRADGKSGFLLPQDKTNNLGKTFLPPSACVAADKERPEGNEKRHLLCLGRIEAG